MEEGLSNLQDSRLSHLETLLLRGGSNVGGGGGGGGGGDSRGSRKVLERSAARMKHVTHTLTGVTWAHLETLHLDQ